MVCGGLTLRNSNVPDVVAFSLSHIIEFFLMGGKGGFAKKSKSPDINIYLYDIYVQNKAEIMEAVLFLGLTVWIMYFLFIRNPKQ